jgi:hypothetical protein
MIGAAIVVNEEDAVKWFGQLLPELKRFDLPVAWILDKCSEDTKKVVKEFPLTVGVKEMEGDTFREKWRGYAIPHLKAAKCKWVVLWDADDTFTPEAPKIIKETLETAKGSVGYVRRLNIVTENGKDFVRVDGPFDPSVNGTQVNRMIIFNMGYDLRWMDDVTHGPYCFDESNQVIDERFQIEAHSIHWGLRDLQLRQEHKERWDKNYTAAIGRNPYGLWNHVLDETITPVLEPYEPGRIQ